MDSGNGGLVRRDANVPKILPTSYEIHDPARTYAERRAGKAFVHKAKRSGSHPSECSLRLKDSATAMQPDRTRRYFDGNRNWGVRTCEKLASPTSDLHEAGRLYVVASLDTAVKEMRYGRLPGILGFVFEVVRKGYAAQRFTSTDQGTVMRLVAPRRFVHRW